MILGQHLGFDRDLMNLELALRSVVSGRGASWATWIVLLVRLPSASLQIR